VTRSQTQGLSGQQQVAGALGDFLRRAHLTTGVVAARMMQELFDVEKRLHGNLHTALSKTSAPWRTSSGSTSSASLWLRPPMLGLARAQDQAGDLAPVTAQLAIQHCTRSIKR